MSPASTLESLFWILVAFLAGSLPLSLWLGKYVLGVDIRDFGDGNPGAANVWRAAGRYWGLSAVLLDSLKGAIPVGLAHLWRGIDQWPLVLIALAPVLGHAYSPFLGFKGGKALAVSFGIWAGLTVWLGPSVLGVIMAFWLALLTVEGWAVLLGMLSFLGFWILYNPEPILLTICIGDLLILAWTHRLELRNPPAMRSWVKVWEQKD